MKEFRLNENLSNRIFLKSSNNLSDRFDAQFYWKEMNFDNCIKLSKIAKVSGGKRLPKGSDYSNEKTNYRYLRISDVSWNGQLNFEGLRYISKNLFDFLKRYEIKKNELLLTIVGTIGKCALLNPPYEDRIILTENCAKIQLKSSDVLPEYLYIVLQTQFVQEQMQLNYIQTTLPKLGLDRVLSLRVPKIPSKERQNEIVDRFYNAIRARNEKLNQAQTLLNSIDDYLLKELGITLPEQDDSLSSRMFITDFSKVSGGRFDPYYNDIQYDKIDKAIKSSCYDSVDLNELCYAVSGVIYSSKDVRNEGKAILRANNITLKTNQLNFDSVRFIDANIQLGDELKLKENDILMSSASGSKEHVGKVAFINEDLDAYFGGFMNVLRQRNDNYIQKYLFFYLQSIIFRKYLFKHLGGTNINNLGFNKIAKLKIPLPSLNKQQEIVIRISDIRDKIRQLQQEAVAAIEAAKQAVEKMILGA